MGKQPHVYTPEELNAADEQRREKMATYNKTYYAENRDELNRIRKVRYHSDPDAKQRIRSSFKEFYLRKKLARGGSFEDERCGPRAPGKFGVTLSDGRQISVTLYSPLQFAKMVGISREVVRKWNRLDRLPEPIHHTPSGARLYTLFQINLFKELAAKYVGKIDRSVTWNAANGRLFAELRERWGGDYQGLSTQDIEQAIAESQNAES